MNKSIRFVINQYFVTFFFKNVVDSYSDDTWILSRFLHFLNTSGPNIGSLLPENVNNESLEHFENASVPINSMWEEASNFWREAQLKNDCFSIVRMESGQEIDEREVHS